MHRSLLTRRSTLVAFAAAPAALAGRPAHAADYTLLNVSYDPTRELYRAINRAFVPAYQKQTGDKVTINQSHGGSGAQTRAVLDGLEADVVTLALAADIDALAKRGLVAENWQARLPDNASPTTSTIVFLVRKGNPKGIKDWGDLVKPGIAVITPNPKTSGGARWNFLAALAWAKGQPGATDASAEAYLRALFRQVPVLDTGARGATNSFAQRGLGDILLAWENEAWLALREFGSDDYAIVYPTISILAEPPVSVVDKNVDKHGTRAVAEAYLKFLYTPEAQDIAARNYYRPRDPAVLARYAERYPAIKMATIQDFGGWPAAQAEYFADGGLFDRIFTPGK
ncbi:sulfate ABC transporter substrate-binding protein [Rhodopila sp.]|uniref:sulfate ABC transporter substrate-binding protein n=1 Tax=Rhodopila sp. TaxID=2480087 RepID=UPI002C2BA897|nr:sulfate ABC transporter substrate-binding protein [Rhodopila sp.]HVZ09770.1 sulfate ABC transporter substrate-binding protein [Rhodopila sp.]